MAKHAKGTQGNCRTASCGLPRCMAALFIGQAPSTPISIQVGGSESGGERLGSTDLAYCTVSVKTIDWLVVPEVAVTVRV